MTCSLTVSRFRTQSGPHNQNAGFISFSLPFLLFVLISYLSFGEKTGKNEKRKKRREKETETKKKS